MAAIEGSNDTIFVNYLPEEDLDFTSELGAGSLLWQRPLVFVSRLISRSGYSANTHCVTNNWLIYWLSAALVAPTLH